MATARSRGRPRFIGHHLCLWTPTPVPRTKNRGQENITGHGTERRWKAISRRFSLLDTRGVTDLSMTRIFPLTFPSHVEDLFSSLLSTFIPTAGGAASAGAAQSWIATAEGGLSYGFLRDQPRLYEYGYGMPWEGTRFRLGKHSCMPIAHGASWLARLVQIGHQSLDTSTSYT